MWDDDDFEALAWAYTLATLAAELWGALCHYAAHRIPVAGPVAADRWQRPRLEEAELLTLRLALR
jgi:hypothetical protein